MKYLLSILILFSGLTFSKNTHLICDTDYRVYPDLNYRIIFRFTDDIKDKSGIVRGLVEKGEYYFGSYEYLREKVKYAAFGNEISIDPKKNVQGWWYDLNRVTLVLTHYLGSVGENRIHQCEVVDRKSFLRAERELKEHEKKQKAKRKI